MALQEVTIQGRKHRLPADLIKRINDDDTLTCWRCGNRIPPENDLGKRAVNILWSHDGITCRPTETELSG